MKTRVSLKYFVNDFRFRLCCSFTCKSAGPGKYCLIITLSPRVCSRQTLTWNEMEASQRKKGHSRIY